MRAIANFVMRGRVQAIGVVSAFALLSFLLMPISWPVSWISGACVGLVVLAKGPRDGVLVILGATVVLSIVSTLLMGNPLMGFAYATVIWLPVWLLANNLRQNIGLSMVLLMGALLGVVMTVGIYVTLESPADWWYEHVTEQVIPMMEEAGVVLPTGPEYEQSIKEATRLMTGMLATLVVFGVSVGLLVARWWQAMLYNPGGFAREFHSLRIGSVAAGGGALIAVLAYSGDGYFPELSANLLPVVIALFLFQGLAVVHNLVARTGGNKGWLIATYILLVFSMPYALKLVAGVGLVDNWLNIRNRVSAKILK